MARVMKEANEITHNPEYITTQLKHLRLLATVLHTIFSIGDFYSAYQVLQLEVYGQVQKARSLPEFV